MPSQILTGSKGTYTPERSGSKQMGATGFTVAQDTCSDSASIPVKFEGAAEVCRLPMKDVTITDLKTSDFQGAS